MIDLPDVNVWIALSAPQHEFHGRAEQYWQGEARSELAINPVTMLGLLRLLSNKDVMLGQPLTASEAWAVFERWMGLPMVVFTAHLPSSNHVLGQFVEEDVVTPRTWTDAYLAACATSLGARLVTFDNDFRRYRGLDSLILDV